MNLYFVNVFQGNFSYFYILYLLIIKINLNKSDLVNFNLVLNSPYWKCFEALVIFIFSNVFNGLKNGLQGGIFLRLNTAVRSKSISISCTTKFMVWFKSKYKIL